MLHQSVIKILHVQILYCTVSVHDNIYVIIHSDYKYLSVNIFSCNSIFFSFAVKIISFSRKNKCNWKFYYKSYTWSTQLLLTYLTQRMMTYQIKCCVIQGPVNNTIKSQIRSIDGQSVILSIHCTYPPSSVLRCTSLNQRNNYTEIRTLMNRMPLMDILISCFDVVRIVITQIMHKCLIKLRGNWSGHYCF